jgi:hypothetical protein
MPLAETARKLAALALPRGDASLGWCARPGRVYDL